MNGVAREYWREILDIHALVVQRPKRTRPRRKEVRIRGRQKVAKGY
jgi:hypothetical protein